MLPAPFPYFGGKSTVASYVWQRFGSVRQYIEPFCGSAAMLLRAPQPVSLEVIGDANHFVANFWRCVKFQPEETWAWSDYPVSHVDQSARHRWLTDPTRTQALVEALQDPEWCGDAKVAGWWVWGQCSWIGSGWCETPGSDQIPHVSNAGRGLQKLGKIPHVSNAGRGLSPHQQRAREWIHALSRRLERVRIVHGSWERCLNRHYGGSSTAVFLDPPYKGFCDIYGAAEVAQTVESYARNNGDARIAICGHAGDYDLPGWDVYLWERKGNTYAGTGTKDQECIWFSPACHPALAAQPGLFTKEAVA